MGYCATTRSFGGGGEAGGGLAQLPEPERAVPNHVVEDRGQESVLFRAIWVIRVPTSLL